jgi:hypothetical protein
MRAGHLYDDGALDLIPGLGTVDECQAGVHGLAASAQEDVRVPRIGIL